MADAVAAAAECGEIADEIERLRADLADQRDIEQALLAEIKEHEERARRVVRAASGALPPGDWRVTVDDDGTADVVPLRSAGERRLDDGMGGTIGPCRPSTVIQLWADATPEQGNDR